MAPLTAYHAATDTRVEMLQVSAKYMNQLRAQSVPVGVPVFFDRTWTIYPEPTARFVITYPDPYEWIEP